MLRVGVAQNLELVVSVEAGKGLETRPRFGENAEVLADIGCRVRWRLVSVTADLKPVEAADPW